jgi:formyl-CoA transferase
MGRPELPEDPRFATIESRKQNQPPIERLITEWTMGMDADEVERLLLGEKLAVTRVATIEDVANNPQLAHRGHFIDVEHPIQGRIRVAGPAVRFSEHPRPENQRIPLAGEHTAEILTDWLGYTPEQLSAYQDNRASGGTADD